jgi:hypothetical protein
LMGIGHFRLTGIDGFVEQFIFHIVKHHHLLPPLMNLLLHI